MRQPIPAYWLTAPQGTCEDCGEIAHVRPHPYQRRLACQPCWEAAAFRSPAVDLGQ